MTNVRILQQLAVPGDSKLVLLVLDGLGGLPDAESGQTELEAAATPTLDRLARQNAVGLATPLIPGVTPGSAPAHLALFGYDAFEHHIGRGVLSAVGVGLDLEPADVACRINFATLKDGVIADRRAGRIPTEEGARLCEVLSAIRIPGVDIVVRPEMQHRAVIVWRGEGLSDAVTDTDPQRTGVAPLPAEALKPEAQRTAEVVNRFVAEANRLLADEPRANTILLRGFGRLPEIPTLTELYRLRAAVIAGYPMYRGLAKLVGMEELPAGQTFSDQLETLKTRVERLRLLFPPREGHRRGRRRRGFRPQDGGHRRGGRRAPGAVGAESGRAGGDRRPFDTVEAARPQLASRAGAAGVPFRPAQSVDRRFRRIVRVPGQPGPHTLSGLDGPDAGPRTQVAEIRGVGRSGGFRRSRAVSGTQKITLPMVDIGSVAGQAGP